MDRKKQSYKGRGRGNTNSPKKAAEDKIQAKSQDSPTKLKMESESGKTEIDSTQTTPKNSASDNTLTSEQFQSPEASNLSIEDFKTPEPEKIQPQAQASKTPDTSERASRPPKPSSSSKPEKPPRKISQERKEVETSPETLKSKIYEPPQPPKSPRAEEPELEIEISAQPKSEVKSEPETKPKSPKPSTSSSVFVYGLGSPVSGLKSDDDDPWAGASPSKIGRPSLADISSAAKRFSARQWVVLIVFGFADLFSAMVLSLQAPFYPPEAEAKGASATEYGLVFGCYELVVFLLSPVFGKYMNKIGPRVIFNCGILTTSVSCVAFGFLDKIDGHGLFIGLSFLLRITEAIGASAFVTSAFTIIACEFPDSVATTFASLETFFGLGLIIGPTVGGALYQLGGYTLPFVVVGAGLFIIALFAAVVMPKMETVSDEHGNSSDGFGIFTILKVPGVLVSGLALMMTSNSIGFLSATLEPHLRQFSLTPLQVGLMFIIYGGVYALVAPGFGWICDRIAKPIHIILMGAVLIFVAFLLIGPAPFIPSETILWMSAVGLVIQGFGLAATLVGGFICALAEAMEGGFPDNISTYGAISGMWTSSVSLGAFLGPSIGGFLYDTVAFRPGTYYVFGCQAFVIAAVIAFILMKKGSDGGEKKSSESEPLLGSTTSKEMQQGPATAQDGYGSMA